MALTERTVTLADARDDLTAEMEAKAAEQAGLPMGSDGAAQAAQEGRRAERFRSGVNWALAEYGEDTTVTFAALTHGERNLARNIAERVGHPGADTNAWVAIGTVDAPYLDHDPAKVPANEAEIMSTVANIPDLHPAFVDWAEQQISDLGRVDGDTGKSYRTLVLESRAQATSPNDNG